MNALLTVMLIGCSHESSLEANVGDTQPDVEIAVPESYQLVIYPGQDRDADGDVRAYPVRLPTVDFGAPIDVDFQRPVTVDGSIFGLNATPRPRASLPGTLGPVDATITFRGEEALQDHRAQTDEDGIYTAFVAPGAHEVFVRPSSPLVPVSSFSFDVTGDDAELPLDLREYAPIWGQVTRAGSPLANAPVRLIFDDGTTGPETYTDADGWYELRATEGTIVGLRSRGSGNGLDPVLETVPAPIGPNGLRHDFALASTPLNTLAARAVTAQQQPLSGIPYRVRSIFLDDYPGGHVDLTGFTDSNGNLTSRLLPGDYTVSLLMERERALTSTQVTVGVRDDLDLGVLRVDGLTAVRGSVLDGFGGAIEGATVLCREVGFLQRSWSASTGELGEYSLTVPAGPLLCSASAGDPELATTRQSIDASAQTDLDFTLTPGARLAGMITFEGVPEPLALIEATDADGNVWGSALSDDSGRFELRLHPLPVR